MGSVYYVLRYLVVRVCSDLMSFATTSRDLLGNYCRSRISVRITKI